MTTTTVSDSHRRSASALLVLGLALGLGHGCGDGGSPSGTDAADATVSVGDTADATAPFIDAADTRAAARDASDAAASDSPTVPTVDAPAAGRDQALDLALPPIDAAADVPAVPPSVDAAASGDGAACNGDVLAAPALTSLQGCDFPTCFADLVKDCLPGGAFLCASGASTIGMPTSTATSLYAYGNGVKGLIVETTTKVGPSTWIGGDITEYWKNANGLCYFFDGGYGYSFPAPRTDHLTLRTPSGVPVANVSRDPYTAALTIACPCSLPVTVPGDCNPWRRPTVDASLSSEDCRY